MKLCEILSGFRKTAASREFKLDGGEKIFTFPELQKVGFSADELVHIRYMKSGETRKLGGKLVQRVDSD